MARFNEKIEKKAEKVRVCVYVDPDQYRRLKSVLALRGETVTSWFEQRVSDEIALDKALR